MFSSRDFDTTSLESLADSSLDVSRSRLTAAILSCQTPTEKKARAPGPDRVWHWNGYDAARGKNGQPPSDTRQVYIDAHGLRQRIGWGAVRGDFSSSLRVVLF